MAYSFSQRRISKTRRLDMRAGMSVNIRMPTLRHISLLVLLGLAVSGCSWVDGKTGGFLSGMLSKKAAKNSKKGDFRMVGVVEMVNPEQNYVLINCDQRQNLAAGTEILAQNADGTRVKLKVTPERKGNYITADIQEGVPQVKDVVLQQIKPGELPAPSTIAADGTAAAAAAAATVSGPPVHLTPIMQADVIPPLDAPFQPMAPVRPTAPLAPTPSPAPPLAAPPPAAPAQTQPEPDGTGLPPVIR